MASKVYWADLRADFHENLQQKLTRLMKTAGMGEIDFDRKFVAIKMHFGEPGNLAFLRPNWAKTVADFVKERGGKPFLTDCNTLYVGGTEEWAGSSGYGVSQRLQPHDHGMSGHHRRRHQGQRRGGCAGGGR